MAQIRDSLPDMGEIWTSFDSSAFASIWKKIGSSFILKLISLIFMVKMPSANLLKVKIIQSPQIFFYMANSYFTLLMIEEANSHLTLFMMFMEAERDVKRNECLLEIMYAINTYQVQGTVM